MRAFRYFNVVIVFCLAGLPSFAQTTTVTGTLTDPAGLVYAGATLKAQLVLAGAGVTGQATVTVNNAQQCRSAGQGSAPCQVPFQGTQGPVTLDSTGSFSVTLQDNSLVTPGGTQWLFSVTIAPGIPPPAGFGPQSCFATVSITGASQSISGSFSCPLLARPVTAGAAGSSGQVQVNNGGIMGGSACEVFPNLSTGPVNVNCDWHPTGPNPYVDIKQFGARACNPNLTPCAAGLTATISLGSPTVATISSASTFVNGDGVVIYGAGPVNALTTPSAPTVTNVLANGGTGTGVVATSAAGATTKCYKVVAADANGGLTAASAETCTTTGQSTLGAITVNLATATRSGSTMTFTTASAHPILVGTGGGEVYIAGNSDVSFNGWFPVVTAANSTTFTVSNPSISTVNGGTTSSSSVGTATFFTANHVTWPSVTNAWQFYIYCGASGTETLCGVSNPEGTNTDFTWDDFANLQTNWTFFPWIPSSPSGSAIADNLSTTITSGAGTTTLTLANAASTAVSSATILLTAGPAIRAAVAASGTFLIPRDAGGGTFVVNDFVDLRANNVNVQQYGNLLVNETVAVNNARWRGYQSAVMANNGPGSWSGGKPLFSVFGGARPGLYVQNTQLAGPDIRDISFFGCSSTNGCLLVLAEGGFSMNFDTLDFVTGQSANDLMGIGLYLRGSNGQSASSVVIDKVQFAPGNNVGGASHNGGFVCNFCGDVWIRSAYMVHRGLLFSTPGAGGTLRIDQAHLNGGGTPLVTVFESVITNNQVQLGSQVLMDTITHPCIAALGTFPTGVITGGSCQPSLGNPGVTGNVFIIQGFSPGANSLITLPIPGLASSGKSMVWSHNDGPISASAANGAIFVDGPAPAAPTITLNAGGTLPNNTVFTAFVVPIWTGSLEGNSSSVSNSVTTSTGNQTITVTFSGTNPPAKCYNVYLSQNNGGPGLPSTGSGTCVQPPSATFSASYFATQILGPIPQAGPTTVLGTQGIVAPLETFGAAPAVSGNAATLSGTGACATITTQVGGPMSGNFTCTGTTGASTILITPGATAAHGFSCSASDETTANILRQSAHSITSCTIAGTVNANDVIVFEVHYSF